MRNERLGFCDFENYSGILILLILKEKVVIDVWFIEKGNFNC